MAAPEIQAPTDADEDIKSQIMEDFDLIELNVGDEFETLEEAKASYNAYGRTKGFVTKILKSRKNNEGEVTWRCFTCDKEGMTNSTYQKKYKDTVKRSGERNRGESKCGCKAKMTLSKKKNKWIVKMFEDNHNHDLATPSKRHFIRSHREVPAIKESLMQSWHEANISTSTQIRMLENEAGGPSQLGFLEKDVYNYEGALRAATDGCDVQSMMDAFETEKEKNDAFFYDCDKDMEDILVRCFWADSDSRNAYAFFGDVIVFDTTFNTNKYGWYLAPFVGVNHHGESTIFGCGLLRDQSTDSFIWLFSKFSEAMPFRPLPRVIITDQDAAITRAIMEVLTGVAHHFCMWHILEKFPAKITVGQGNQVRKALIDVIMNSETPYEFEVEWNKTANIPILMGNKWLSDIYAVRHKWVPAYVKNVFSAGMLSSQRAESNHSFLKKNLDPKCTLNEVVTRITRAIVRQRNRENLHDHRDNNEIPKMITNCEMEKQMARLYTKGIFNEFQLEFKEKDCYKCVLLHSSDDCVTFEIHRFNEEGIFGRPRQLALHVSSGRITCSCKRFDFEGIPCRHMLCWMRIQQVMIMPEQYILHRWTKRAKVNPVYETSSYLFSGQPHLSRSHAIHRSAAAVADAAALTKDRSIYLAGILKNAMIHMQGMDDGGAVVSHMESSSARYDVDIRDPLPKKGLSRKRIKSSKEKATSRKRIKSNKENGTCMDLFL